MSYKTPISAEVQNVVTAGIREMLEPLTKADRAAWQPLLTTFAYAEVRDSQVREAQRADRSRRFRPENPADAQPYAMDVSNGAAAVAETKKTLAACLEQGGREQFATILEQKRAARMATLQEMNTQAMQARAKPAPAMDIT